jgi:hypothetical protein
MVSKTDAEHTLKLFKDFSLPYKIRPPCKLPVSSFLVRCNATSVMEMNKEIKLIKFRRQLIFLTKKSLSIKRVQIKIRFSKLKLNLIK